MLPLNGLSRQVCRVYPLLPVVARERLERVWKRMARERVQRMVRVTAWERGERLKALLQSGSPRVCRSADPHRLDRVLARQR